MKILKLHPNAIKAQYQIAESAYMEMQGKYDKGSTAMKYYLSPKLAKLKKTYEKWKSRL